MSAVVIAQLRATRGGCYEPLVDVHEHGDARLLDQRAPSLSLASGLWHASSFQLCAGSQARTIAVNRLR
jgi:hypothetical protein